MERCIRRATWSATGPGRIRRARCCSRVVQGVVMSRRQLASTWPSGSTMLALAMSSREVMVSRASSAASLSWKTTAASVV